MGQDGSETLTAPQISEREGISAAYANKLLHILRGSGLIESVRGANGGFRLARPAREITLADVMRALDSFLFATNLCASFPGKMKTCVHYSKSCSIRAVWNVMMGEIRSLLSRTTLNELAGTSEQNVGEMMRLKIVERARGFDETDGGLSAKILKTKKTGRTGR